ncbi:MAG: hypothetical protein KGO47_04505 [Cyanobacteria bacterium REEB417]|nr:hypothetical protein [Cyanobacteria bacterium REEB417]
MSDALQDRYAAVERLYGQGQWEQVLQTSAALLGDLPKQPGESLRTRLLLLQAHAHLHGLGQIDSAAALYHQVLEEQPEPLLQAIAQRELARCHGAPKAAPPGPAFPFVAEAIGTPAPDQAASAMPWLEALAPQTPVDVVEEPEQIAVLQAGSHQDEPLDLEPVPQPQPEPEPTAPIPAAPRWSPADEAELAKGMLLVVLGSAGG